MENAFDDQSQSLPARDPLDPAGGTLPLGMSGPDSGAAGPGRESIRVLLVGNSDTDSRQIELLLGSRKSRLLHEVDFVLTCQRMPGPGLPGLEQQSFDAVLLDLGSLHFNQLEAVRRIVMASAAAPVIVLAHNLSLSMAVRTLRCGAEDSLDKGELSTHHLSSSVLHAIERRRRRLMEEKLGQLDADQRAAGMVQAALFPKAAPHIRGLTIAGACHQADHVGGDYYDFFHLIDNQFGFVLADVSSHGFTPALIMAGLRRLLRTLAQTTANIGSIVTLANRAILEDTLDTQFVTLFFASVDVHRRSLRYVAAGHPGYLVARDGGIVGLHDTSLPLGIRPTTYITSDEIPLHDFQLLFALTDGYTETLNPSGDVYGIERAAAVVAGNRGRSPEQIIHSLSRDVGHYRGEAAQVDDCAAVIVKLASQNA